uniref:Uncharacterized protein n=1 Tax=Anopheles epiroticus TaxID=199890 RepID=A0A182PYV8_9DIPT
MSHFLWFLSAALSLCLALCFLHFRKKYSFWRELGIPFVPAGFPLGNIQHTSHQMLDLYKELKGKHPIGGVFQFTEPVAMITDPEMIKNVLVRDFRHFYDRGGYADGTHDPLSGHMLNSESDRWRVLRHGSSPIFSTGRLRAFFPEMLRMMDEFRAFLDAKLASEGETVELKGMLGQLTTDISVRFLLGGEGNNLNAPERDLYQAITNGAFILPSLWKQFLMTCYRSVAKKLRLRVYTRELTEAMKHLVAKTIDDRAEGSANACRRINLIDQLLKLPGFEGKGSLTLEEIAGQVFLFVGAYETNSLTTFYCLHELAQRLDLQQRARACVLEALDKHGGITYEAIADMPYLDQCINETLRKNPPSINLIRVTTEDYPVPDSTGVVLPKGLNVVIPVYAIHYDAEYYPDPERFDPDRFAPEASSNRTPYTFLPFGGGPKNCIGYRQGKMHLRTMLAMLLCSYEFSECPKIIQGTRSEKHSVLKLKGNLWLRVRKLHRMG